MPPSFEATEDFARELDRIDTLARFRNEFYQPHGQIYLDGNSLGLLCRGAEAALLKTLRQWQNLAIGGWLDASGAWFDVAEQLGARISPFIGAEPDEVIVANSTTVNLHQLLATFYDPAAAADVILADMLCFPSDRYAIESFLRLVGKSPKRHARFAASEDGWTLSEDAIIAAMARDVQIVVLPSVVFTSGQLLDVRTLTRAAHERGILLGLDCSHSVGVVPHQLDLDDVDFAFFCTYKYLNGGPGSPGALYLNRRHFGRRAGLAGWFGSDKSRQFEMSSTFQQASHAGGLQIGTPSILAAAPLCGALELIQSAGMNQIRAKSLELTSFLSELVGAKLGDFGFQLVTPPETPRRGGHVAISHVAGQAIASALRTRGVVPDFRPPGLIRLAPAPLYTSFLECYKAVDILLQIMQQGDYKEPNAVDERIP